MPFRRILHNRLQFWFDSNMSRPNISPYYATDAKIYTPVS